MKIVLFIAGFLSIQGSFAIVPHVWKPIAEKTVAGAMWFVKKTLNKVLIKSIKTTAKRVLPEQGYRCVLKLFLHMLYSNA